MCGLLYIRVLVTEGAIGVVLKSKVLLSYEYDERLGFSLEGWRGLNLIYTCYRRQYKFYIGKYGSVENNPSMK